METICCNMCKWGLQMDMRAKTEKNPIFILDEVFSMNMNCRRCNLILKKYPVAKLLKISLQEREHSSFNALVFACSGGAGPSASRAMKQLATKISEKRGEPYADTIS